ncbi:factor IF-3 [Seminavis robusta]|uniref:Factor IF-3 n=1 Tax=Seminavis robusta TaxID=568900 RepID=A0A9N8HNP2_9STRA|nr:factor IF-3 [Seminavis robusta]|eukprot:Sro1003_g230020.1 factor IF-3 (320) ;mRNA; f:16948-17907
MKLFQAVSTLVAVSAMTNVATGFTLVAPRSLATTPLVTSSSPTTLMARGGGRRGGRGNRDVVQEVKPTMNEEIQATELRVVTPNPKGKDDSLGIMSRAEALAKAKDMGGLDLILVNDKSDPPVCKIVDYSKYRYMLEKKAKELKKNSKATEIKEVKMSYKIDVHDYGVRKKNALKFLAQGNRVKCTVMFRGREVQHDNLGFDLLEKLAEDLDELAAKEGRPKREGRNLSVILSPRAEVLKAVNEKRRADDKAKKKNKKVAFEEKLAAKASTDAAAATTNALAAEGLNGELSVEDTIIDMESSLDDLLGGSDDLTDDIFS